MRSGRARPALGSIAGILAVGACSFALVAPVIASAPDRDGARSADEPAANRPLTIEGATSEPVTDTPDGDAPTPDPVEPNEIDLASSAPPAGSPWRDAPAESSAAGTPDATASGDDLVSISSPPAPESPAVAIRRGSIFPAAPVENAAAASRRFIPRSGGLTLADATDATAAAADASIESELAGGSVGSLLGGPGLAEWLQVGGALAIVLGLAVLTRVLVSRRTQSIASGGARPSGVVSILARFPVGRGQQLLLVEVGRRVLVLHQAGTSMTTVSEFSDAHGGRDLADLRERLGADERERNDRGFGRTLKRSLERWPRESEAVAADSDLVDLTRRAAPTRRRALAGSAR